jgi:hypothetical protein
MCVTVAVTVTASGHILPSLLVFKGTPGLQRGQPNSIQAELNGIDSPDVLRVQERAWMSHDLCVAWIDEVLAPYVKNVPKGIVPLLLLDQYKCHLMASIVNRIEALGVQVEHIPSGCTGLVQPVDVGIGKPLKNRMRHQWEEFMIDEGMKTSFTKPPS